MRRIILLLFTFQSLSSFAQDSISWSGLNCKLQFMQRQLGRDLPSREFKDSIAELLPAFDSTKTFLPREVDRPVKIKTDKKGYKSLLKTLNLKPRKWKKYYSGLKGCESYHTFYRNQFFINPKKKYFLIWIEVSVTGKISIEKMLPKTKEGQLEKVEEILNYNFEITPATFQDPSTHQFKNVASKEVIFISER